MGMNGAEVNTVKGKPLCSTKNVGQRQPPRMPLAKLLWNGDGPHNTINRERLATRSPLYRAGIPHSNGLKMLHRYSSIVRAAPCRP